jgi:transposase-like protein
VAYKYFQNPARRAWWSVHLAAWRQSGLPLQAYCRQKRLHRHTFTRWIAALEGAHVPGAEQEKRRQMAEAKRRRPRVSPDGRSRAVRGFWAMHVEAMTWMNLSPRAYAGALRLSEHSLKRWRDLIEAGEVDADWRALLHPAAREISPRTKPMTKDGAEAEGLTAAARPRRRRFSDEEKLAVVLASEQPGASVSAVARDHDVALRVLFRWRAERGYGAKPARLVSVVVRDEPAGAAP